MSSSPSLSFDVGEPSQAPLRVSLRSATLSLLVATRECTPFTIIPALLESGFTSVERPIDQVEAFLALLHPGLVVAWVDPAIESDANLLRRIALSESYLLVIAPTPFNYADALEAGADSCLCDGDSPKMLVAQLNAIHRRLIKADAIPAPRHELEVGGFVLDRKSRRLRRGSDLLPLTPMEYSVFEQLVVNRGRVLSSTALLFSVTGRTHPDVEASQTVKVYIRRLRQKLESFGAPPDLISTIRGHGYLVELFDLAESGVGAATDTQRVQSDA